MWSKVSNSLPSSLFFTSFLSFISFSAHLRHGWQRKPLRTIASAADEGSSSLRKARRTLSLFEILRRSFFLGDGFTQNAQWLRAACHHRSGLPVHTHVHRGLKSYAMTTCQGIVTRRNFPALCLASETKCTGPLGCTQPFC